MRFLLFFLIFFVVSCGLTKKINKKDTAINEKEQITTSSVRQGDTVTFFVPQIKLKDTTIYSVNRVGTRIETRYDSKGQIDRIDCMSSAITDLTNIIRERELNERTKEKDEEFKMDKTTVIVGGIIIFVLLILILIYVHIQLKSVKTMFIPK